MAKGKNEAKITFLAETDEFRANTKQAESSMKELTSELRLNAEQMKTNGASVEGLTDRQKLLEEQLEQSRTKTANLEAQMESCVRNFGEGSAEAQKLATQIINAKVAEEKIQQQINRVNAELKEQVEASQDAENAMDKLENTISQQESTLEDLKRKYAAAALEYGKNSKQAKGLAKEIQQLSGELNENRDKMATAERAADNLSDGLRDAGDAAEDAENGFTVLKGTLANLASSAITGAIDGLKNLASSMWNLGDETRELRTNLGKVEVAFEEAGFSAETASATYSDFYAIVADEGQATEAVSHLAKLTDSQKELDQWTTICTGVYATFGDSLPIENLTEASNETA
jgi:chromosome segregation ATPase